jgi:hypothetical protein
VKTVSVTETNPENRLLTPKGWRHIQGRWNEDEAICVTSSSVFLSLLKKKKDLQLGQLALKIWIRMMKNYVVFSNHSNLGSEYTGPAVLDATLLVDYTRKDYSRIDMSPVMRLTQMHKHY